MSHLVSLENVSLAFGLHPLLDQIKLQIDAKERICLIGRNGAGKSSLLKIVEGSIQPDTGSVWRKPHLRIARLEQSLPQGVNKTVYEFVAEGLAEASDLLKAYHALTHRLSVSATEEDLTKLASLERQLEAKNAWQFEQNIKTILNRLELNPDLTLNQLSGGWQRRAALAKALVSAPELLLLDEPTNHLDIEAIQWLEDQLLNCQMSLLFITHDRALLQRLATRIIELDRGQLTSWPGDYDNFLRRKEEMLHAEAKHHADFDKKLAQEERWIRQGIKARRTRNEGRVRALEALRRDRAKRREVEGKAAFSINAAEKSGQIVVEAKEITHHIADKLLINQFSLRLMRGDRIGLIGPNGVGKSTLLSLLLGEKEPQKGTVTQGTKLQIAYFDQLRAALDLEKTVIDNVAGGRDSIEINGKTKHIISYLNEFLFTPERALTRVKALSGGECNRLLLARLFSQPANLLVLDEPTNDLDIETLELLEELLNDYQGTLLLVSHDRVFLDNVVTSTLVFEGEGKIQEYIGGYADWQRQRKNNLNEQEAALRSSPKNISQSEKRTVKKLSFKEQKELTELPKKIEQLELEQAHLLQQTSSLDFYKQDSASITQSLAKLKQIETDLKCAYERWEELEAQSANFNNKS